MSHRTLEKLLVVSICVTLFSAVVSPASAALTRHWELDDGSGTNASDATTNADGTLTNFPGSPGWTTGQINGALTFDGADDYIAAGSDALGSAYTITAWFKADSFQPNDDHILFSQYNGDPGRSFFGVQTVAGIARLDLFEGTGAGHQTSTTTLSTGTWYFGAITRSGTGVGSGNLYLNGGLENTFAFAQNPPSAANYIGGEGGANFGYFPGTIDDVRVYNTALSSQQIQASYVHLDRHWKLDDGSGNVAIDSTGNADGTLNNFPGSPGWTTGQIDGALSFDGVDDNIAAGSGGLGSTYTITGWFKADSFRANDDHVLFSQYSGADGRTLFEVKTDANNVALLDIFEGSGAGHQSGTTELDTDTWYFAAITRSGDGSGMLYLNGDIENTFSFSQTPPNVANYIGGVGDFDFGYFDGLIDDVRVYRKALSTDEIHALYVAGVPEPNSIVSMLIGLIFIGTRAMTARRRLR